VIRCQGHCSPLAPLGTPPGGLVCIRTRPTRAATDRHNMTGWPR